jgi:hypothetical protein
MKRRWKKKAEEALKLSRPYIEACITGVDERAVVIKKNDNHYGWRVMNDDDKGGIGEGQI